MHLNTFISAANWLYCHSPAKYVTTTHNAILVYGGGEEADAVFDLLFSTAFRPGVHIQLVRVAPDAEKREEQFLERNLEGIQVFTENVLSGPDDQRPMTISFCEPSSEWKERYSFCWAYAPDSMPGDGDECFSFDAFPQLHPACEVWSAADEMAVPVLRIARRVHTAYTAGWNSSYREEEIDRELYGEMAGEKDDSYILRSSLRLAVSIPWKLEIAEAWTPESLSVILRSGKVAKDGHTVREYLAWQEHRSWQAFMTLEGWRMPSETEMRQYLFIGGNDHRDKKQKLHPCLCDLEDDWFAPHTLQLSRIRPSDWSRMYAKSLDDFSAMDRMSLTIHHRCKEITVSPVYSQRMNELFSDLEHAVIAMNTARSDLLFRWLRLMENMFERLKDNEPNSFDPFRAACRRFEQELGQETEDTEQVRQRLKAVLREAETAVERNQYCNYREIDGRIIDQLPWILDDSVNETVWKLYAPDNPVSNIASALLLRPAELVLVFDGSSVAETELDAYRELLEQHGLEGTTVRAEVLSGLKDRCLPPEDASVSRSVVDVTGAGNFQHRVRIRTGTRTVYYEGGRLQDKAGAPFFAPMYRQNVRMTVDEILRLKGQTNKASLDDNEALGMEEDFETLWTACRQQKALGNWRATVEALQGAEEKLRGRVFRERGSSGQEMVCSMTEEQYSLLLKNGVIRTLFDLQEMGAVSALGVYSQGQMTDISMNVFPDIDNGGKNPCKESERTIRFMIQDAAKDEGVYAVDDEYIGATDPAVIVDLSEPLRMGSADPKGKTGLEALTKAGLLRSGKNPGEYFYKSQAVRHGLKKEGFALEAYVYYTLFLSGAFDDVRSNVALVTGWADEHTPLEKEMDVLVTYGGRLGILSCKDTPNVSVQHIIELAQQCRTYGIGAKAILVCPESGWLDETVKKACEMLQVTILGMPDLVPAGGSRKKLVADVLGTLRK